MRVFLLAFALFTALVIFVASAAFMIFVDPAPLSTGEYLNVWTRTAAFKYTGFPELTDKEVETLYKWRCTGICHGSEPIERSAHTAREWDGIVNRMRSVNEAKVSSREALVITRYLQKNFVSNVPTILSPKANKYLKRHLWKSDFGESDLYVDVIYAPMEYFDLLGGPLEAEKYGASEKSVFMVYLNTHQGKLDRFDLAAMALLKDNLGREYRPVDWQVTYESGDLHHREGVLRFVKLPRPSEEGEMELHLKDLPGRKVRIFYWETPIPTLEAEGVVGVATGGVGGVGGR